LRATKSNESYSTVIDYGCRGRGLIVCNNAPRSVQEIEPR
jgi:hypothetical protein